MCEQVIDAQMAMSRFHRDGEAYHVADSKDPTPGADSDHHTRRQNGRSSPLPQADSIPVQGDKHASASDSTDDMLASLRKRMAGPSSNKAGLAVDQDEINRKIYEASKGSKFFENEKRSDQRTTQQIQAMLARRDARLREVPEGSEAWKAAERRMDERALALEGTRDLSRTILHADMDMFYAAVELKRDPTLKGKAFGVGSGVLVTASYEARKMGCRSGMATHIALALCPDLIIVKNDMSSYVDASREVMAIFEEYDPNYAQMSLDEAYMDITPYCEMYSTSSDDVVKELRERVQKETGLTVSVGIAPNKMLAKISSDRNKPNGQFRVEANRNFIVDMMQDLPCRKIPGIGRVTERILSSLGVNTCGDIWHSRTLLHLTLGEIDWLLSAHLGIHSNVVEPAKRGERRSVGREHTFRPTSKTDELKDYLRQSAAQVAKDLERLDYRGKTVTLTFKTDAFRRFTRAKTTLSYVWKEEDLFSITSRLLDAEISARGGPFALRLIGVRLSSLKDLREPEDGGIKGMLTRAASKSPEKRQRHSSGDKHLGSDAATSAPADDDDFERAMQLAMERSLAQDSEIAVVKCSDRLHSPDLQRAESETNRNTQCPVCHGYLKLHRTEATDERSFISLMSSHIDRCLTGQGASDVSATASPTSPPLEDEAQRRKKRRTLDSFFHSKS